MAGYSADPASRQHCAPRRSALLLLAAALTAYASSHWALLLGRARPPVAAARGRPCVVRSSLPEAVELRHAETYLQELGLTEDQIKEAVRRIPRLLDWDVESRIVPHVKFFKEVGMTASQTARAIASSKMLTASVDKNLKPVRDWLGTLGLTKAAITKALNKWPGICSCSVDANLKQTALWLGQLGLTEAEITKVATAFPNIFKYSLDANLKRTVLWLGDLGLTDQEIAKVTVCFPMLFGCSLDGNLKPKVAFLSTHLDAAAVAKLVVRCPQVLSYSSDRLRHRTDVLKSSGLLSAAALANAMVRTDADFAKRYSSVQESET